MRDAYFKYVYSTLDCAGADYRVCGLRARDRSLAITNNQGGEVTWFSAECSNRILNTNKSKRAVYVNNNRKICKYYVYNK